MKNPLIFVCGPTASGKTNLSLALAQEGNGEIINADAICVYKHMNIGSAKPSPEDLLRVTHHMIDVLNPDEPISVAWFSMRAKRIILDVLSRGKRAIVVGGSGFYLQSLLSSPLDVCVSNHSAALSLAEQIEVLQHKLPNFFDNVHKNDSYRISRAYNLLMSGYNPMEHATQGRRDAEIPDPLWLGIRWDRTTLYEKINARTHQMYALGLVEETQRILELFPGAESKLAKTIGYSEALDVISKKLTQSEAMAKTAQKSRNYAKRQWTWFKNRQELKWIDCPKDNFDVASILTSETL